MNGSFEPSEMTTDERFAELAAILAQGVLRSRRLREIDHDSPPQNSPESSDNPLDVSAETRLSVSRLVNGQVLDKRRGKITKTSSL